MQILKLDPRALKDNPDDARRSKSSPQADALLLATVKAVGIIQPPIVSPQTDGGNGYIIQAGHRRVRQAIAAGLEEIEVIVREAANDNGARNGNAINLDRSNTRVFEDNGRGARNMQVNPDATNVQPSSRRSGGFFNFGRGNNSGNSDRGFQRSESNGFSQPSRGGFERSAPQQNRSFSNPAPSRSFGNGGGGGFSSPSRSGGGGFSGGGARSGGGGRGR